MNDVKVDSNDIEEMYIKYYTPLKRYCMKLVSYNSRYTVIAEDCVQEAFYRAVCHAEDFASSQNQYGWLAACCSHYMLSYIRKAKRREEIIGQHRTNELVRWQMNFLSDAIADFAGLLAVNQEICKQQMAKKALPTLPTNCAVLP